MPTRKEDDSAAGMAVRPAGPRQRTPEHEAMKDEEIDTSDIPEITEKQWTKARFIGSTRIRGHVRLGQPQLCVWVRAELETPTGFFQLGVDFQKPRTLW